MFFRLHRLGRGGVDRLEFPLPATEEYRLQVDVARDAQRDRDGANALVFGLVSGGARVLLVAQMDGRGGLALLDGQYHEANETAFSVPTLADRERRRLTCVVRKGAITVAVDGRKVSEFRGDFSRLKMVEGWDVPHKDRLFIGTQCCFQFTRIEVTPLKAGEPDVVAEIDASGGDRSEAPGIDALAIARAALKKRFGSWLSAKKSADKLSAARILLTEAAKSETEAAAAYVMLVEAANLAASGGDYLLAVGIVEELAARWKTHSAAMKWELFSRWQGGQKGAEGKASVAEAAYRLMTEAALEADYDIAKKSAEIAATAASSAKNKDLSDRVKGRAGDVRDLLAAWKAVEPAFKKLAEAPDDAQAKRLAGAFLCFQRGDWASGLPLLAESDDEPLANAARQDGTEPSGGDDMAALAEAWSDAATKLKGSERLAAQARAVHWLDRAINVAAAPQQARLQRRRDELSASLAGGAPGRWLNDYRHRLEFAREFDCSGPARSLTVPPAFDLARGWEFDMQYRLRDKRAEGLLLLWGDGRAGRDPIAMYFGDKTLNVVLADSSDDRRSATLACTHRPLDSWRTVRIIYTARIGRIRVFLDGAQVKSENLSFVPHEDYPMPMLLGGDSPSGQGFTGWLRGLLLVNTGS